jgi:hypothetical protein
MFVYLIRLWWFRIRRPSFFSTPKLHCLYLYHIPSFEISRRNKNKNFSDNIGFHTANDKLHAFSKMAQTKVGILFLLLFHFPYFQSCAMPKIIGVISLELFVWHHFLVALKVTLIIRHLLTENSVRSTNIYIWKSLYLHHHHDDGFLFNFTRQTYVSLW